MNVNYREGKCTAKKIFFFFLFSGPIMRDCNETFFFLHPSRVLRMLENLLIFYQFYMGTIGNDVAREKKNQPARFFFYLCIQNEGLMLWLSQALFSRSHLFIPFRLCIWRVYAKTSFLPYIFIWYLIMSLTYIHHIRYTR